MAEFSTDDESAGRVIRGGSWDDNPRLCRCASRNIDHLFTVLDYYVMGFRVVCEYSRIRQ